MAPSPSSPWVSSIGAAHRVPILGQAKKLGKDRKNAEAEPPVCGADGGPNSEVAFTGDIGGHNFSALIIHKVLRLLGVRVSECSQE